MVAPMHVTVSAFRGIVELPFFNPDLDGETLPPSVIGWRTLVENSDAVVFCSPEYIGGIAGVLKNAIEWLGGSVALYNRPVAVINASPRAHHADAALKLVLRTISARLIDSACIELPILGRNMDAAMIAADGELAERLLTTLMHLKAATSRQ